MHTPNMSTGPACEAEQTFTGLRAVVVGASPELAVAFASRRVANDLPISIQGQTAPDVIDLPALLAGSQIAILADSTLAYDIARQCTGLQHIIFLSQEARPGAEFEMLESLGIMPHTLGQPAPVTVEAIADAAIEQCRRIVSPTGG